MRLEISEFQRLMKDIYYEKDSKRGIEGTIRRLREEVDELEGASLEGSKRAIADELADVLAWLASLANILDADLQKAALSKYCRGCPRCLSSPCRCEDLQT
jgi:NTP pyrophosphatase (non-canonical NTP hydrolase)